jgi:hypothetical protein
VRGGIAFHHDEIGVLADDDGSDLLLTSED